MVSLKYTFIWCLLNNSSGYLTYVLYPGNMLDLADDLNVFGFKYNDDTTTFYEAMQTALGGPAMISTRHVSILVHKMGFDLDWVKTLSKSEVIPILCVALCFRSILLSFFCILG